MHGATESSEREAWERTVEQIDKPTGPNSRAAKRWPEAGETPCRWETSSRDAPTSDRGKLGDEWETITSARTAVRGQGSLVDCRGTRNLGGGRERLPAGMIRATYISRPKMGKRNATPG